MKRIFGILAILLVLPFIPVFAQEPPAPDSPALAQNGAPHPPTSRIIGKIVDLESGLPIIGARVFIEGSVPTIGAVTDLNGNYTLRNVPPGSYTVVITYPEYAKVMVTGLNLAENETRQQDISLKPEVKQVQGEVVEVVAKASRGSAAGLLKDRQKAAAVSDAIGAEEISRTGSSDAAQAMSKVTGATVVDGKYVYVRGLGERYSTTQLNGSELPSTDPNKRAVHLDLFAANLLENIVTTKSYTPDKPGNFTGGSVNLVTKSYPDHFNATLSLSSAYNSQVNLREGFLTYAGGRRDWLGMDDGTRAIPDLLQDPNYTPPALVEAWRDTAKARELDLVSKSFNSHMAPSRKQAPLNRNFSFSIGDQLQFLGRPLGILGSLSYNRDFHSYTNGQVGRWRLQGDASGANLIADLLLKDAKSADEVVWGGLGNLTFQPHPKHELKANYMYNRSGESVARYLAGSYPYDLGDAIFETRTLQYTERSTGSLQFSGHHFLERLLNVDLNWNGSFARSRQNEPDLRFFSDAMSVDSSNGSAAPPETTYSIRDAGDYTPARFYRDLREENLEFNFDFSVPFKQWNGLAGKLKLGGGVLGKDRNFNERRFRLKADIAPYDGDPEYFFSDTVMGINEAASGGSFTRFGNYITRDPDNRYSAERNISSFFGMLDFPLWKELRFAGGFRLEADRTKVFGRDRSILVGRYSNDDWLPSANFIYQLGRDLNLRASYSRTLARPEFRELANYLSYPFVGGERYIGNPNLKRTLINNYDLRWEWFARPGEIVSVSGFYKRFQDPIELTIGKYLDDVSPKNVPHAKAYGVEFEARKRLDQIGSFLQNLQVGANLTLVHTRVDIDSGELAKIRASDPGRESTRSLQGQSPYILNLDLSYGGYKSGTTVSLLYNVFGKRLSAVSSEGNPDVFEQSRGQFDFTFSQKIWKVVTLKASARNLLDSEFSKVYTFKGKKYPYEVYKKGRSISAGFSWAID